MQLSSWVIGPASALFPGHLPLCFFDRIHDLWTIRRSGKRPGTTHTLSNRKINLIMTHVWIWFQAMCLCLQSFTAMCSTFWSFSYLASTNNSSCPQMSRFVVYLTPVAYTETETHASLYKYQFTQQAVPQWWTCRRHIRSWLRLLPGTAAVNCSGAIREGWGPHICRCPQSNSYSTK